MLPIALTILNAGFCEHLQVIRKMMPKDEITAQEPDKPVTVSSASSLDSCMLGMPSIESIDAASALPTLPSILDDSEVATSQSVVSPAVDQTLPAGAVLPSLMLPTAQPTSGLTNNLLLPGGPSGHSVPEFLYQLTKMLTDDNKEIIEWSNGT